MIRRHARLGLALAFLATLAVGAAVGGFAVLSLGGGPSPWLEPWHQIRPRAEFRGGRAPAVNDLGTYRELETALFDEVGGELRRTVTRFPSLSRFDPQSATHPSRFDRDWNRTFELAAAQAPRGEALLLHGLSDSPYSLRAVAEILTAAGFHVVGLRLPGHGAAPGGLAAAARDDWRAAVRLGVAATGGSPGAEHRPFVLVGYSNGAALALDYTLAALASPGDRVPDRLVFLSPAFAVTSAAALARWQERASHLPRLARLAWYSIEAEFDPFKFNSFPMRGAAEVHALTSEIAERLGQLAAAPARRALPPLLTLQSVVDATVPPVASLERLYSHIPSTDHDSGLVLFDANRHAAIASFLGPEAEELLALATPGRRFPFRTTLITNAAPDSARVVALERAAGSLETVRVPLDLAWPAGVYSLSHVAVPFPPSDPVYGVEPSPAGPPFPFGRLEVKGERGLFLVPPGHLSRLRYNPFFAVVRAELLAFLESMPALTAPPAGDTTGL
jgi:alpha-beta hydrolase superfamily lysophospholipase